MAKRVIRKKKIIKKPRKSVPKTRNAGKWTESQYFSRIRSALRRTFRFWGPMQLALDKASRPSRSENKRLKKEYQCAHCKEWFKRADVEVDHIIPCGSLNSYKDIPSFLERLTPESIEAFQVLCKPCHLIKTKKDRENDQ